MFKQATGTMILVVYVGSILYIYNEEYMNNDEEARFAVTPSFVLMHSSDSI